MKSNKANYLLNLISNYGNIFVTIILGFIVPPLSLNYWKIEKYGVWALITSVVLYLSISGFGIDTSASILMAKNKSFQDKTRILLKAFKLMTITIIIGITIFTLLNIFYSDWIFILGKIPKILMHETYIAVLVFAAFYFINLPFSLISSSYSGFQKLYIDNFFKIFGSAISFISLMIVIYLKGSLITFAIIIGFITLIFNVVKMVFFYFAVYRKEKKANKNNFTEQESGLVNPDIRYSKILSTGIRLAIFGIASMIINIADNFVISNFIDVSHVTPYSITYKLFFIMINIVTMFYGSIQPILGKEFSEGNWEWINKTYRNFLAFTCIIGGSMWLGGIFFIKDFIIHFWVGKDGFAGIMAVFFLGAFCYLQSLINLNNVMIIAFNYTKGFAIIGWIEAFLHVGFAIFFSRIFGLGGIAFGAFLGSLFGQAWLSPFLLLKRSKNKLRLDILLPIKNLLILIPFIFFGVLIQYYINDLLFRLLSGILFFVIYLIINYLILPVTVKLFFVENVNILLKKFHVEIPVKDLK